MHFSIGCLSDLNGIIALLNRYHLQNISENEKNHGFVTTTITEEQIASLILNERSVFVAKSQNHIIGFIMAMPWNYCEQWPLHAYMIDKLSHYQVTEHRLSLSNSCFLGPICIAHHFHGRGVLEGLYKLVHHQMLNKTDFLVSFIHKLNQRSYIAHMRKTSLTVIDEFTFENNDYYLVACPLMHNE